MKQELKTLNTNQFAKVADRVAAARAALYETQELLQHDWNNEDLQQQEQDHLQQFKYWNAVEESIIKQKARVDWLQLGDSNTKYFYAALKQRQSRNKLLAIYGEDDKLYLKPAEVRQEVERFSNQLLGTKADVLPPIDLHTVRAGPQLEVEDKEILIRPVKTGKVTSVAYSSVTVKVQFEVF